MITENLLSTEAGGQQGLKMTEGLWRKLRGGTEGAAVGAAGEKVAGVSKQGAGRGWEEGSGTKQGKIDIWEVKKLVRELEPGVNNHEFVVTGLARMLMKLYEHREAGMEPRLLFGYSGVKKKTGYRYVSLLRGKKYVGFIGARQKGKYILTEIGRKAMIGMQEGAAEK
ncbi:MAG: hypothetical protein ABI855_06580 [Bacteroidota bacterium]